MSNEIKKLRRGLKLTQEAFARLLGVSIRSVAGWEGGRSKPRGLSIRRLEEIKKEMKEGE